MNLPVQAQPVIRNEVHVARILNKGVTPSNYETCVSATYDGHKVCIDIPILGRKCISLPVSVPIGAGIDLCADICTILGIPTGACLVAKFNGQEVAKQCFGHC